MYIKSGKLSNSSKLETETGRILNMYTTDTSNLYDFIYAVKMLVSFPLSLVICLTLFYIEVGWIIVVAFFIALIGSIVMKIITWGSVSAMNERITHSDKRTKYVNEYINGIRIIKYYAWEYFALGNIKTARDKEVRGIAKEEVYRTFMELLFTIIPLAIIISTIGTYLATGGKLTVSKIYVIAMLAGMLSVYIYIYILYIYIYIGAIQCNGYGSPILFNVFD